MKKHIYLAAFAAALALSSCDKEAPVVTITPSDGLRTVNFCAQPVATKTVFGEKSGSTYPVFWQEGDKICPSFNFTSPNSSNYITVTPSADGTSASFQGQFSEAESYQFILVSPAAIFKSCNKTNNTILVEFPSGQTSTAASPDPAAQILYANTGVLTEVPNQIDVEFSHLSAYLHVKFSNVSLGTATVQAVNITNEDYPLAGRIFYNVGTGAYEASTTFHTIAVATSTLEDVWCALCPANFSSKQITFEISTDQGTLTKTVTMPASAILTGGKIAKFTVDMAGVPLVAPVVYSAITSADDLNVGDRVIIAAAGDDQAFAMSTGQNSNNRSAAGVTKTATEITNPTGSVEIFVVEDGVVPGHYAFRATGTENPGYIYAANQSGSNILRTKATMDNSASWAISVENVTVSETTWTNATRMFADIPSSGRGLVRFNSNDKLFSAYGAGTSQEAIRIYRLDETPSLHFNATLPNGTDVSASAQDVTVYVWGNVAWTASATGTSASLDETSGTGNAVLTLSIPENTDTENTKAYSVTVTTTAAVGTQSYTLNITQAKKIDPNNGPQVGDILYWEYFEGATNLQSPAAYLSSGNATTTVFGGASVTYTSAAGSGNTRAYVNDNIVYDGDFATYLPSSVTQETNMMIGKGGGWLKIAGIPCVGVATAFLEYDSNNVPDGTRYVSSPTDGVSMGTVSYDTYRSTANDKAIRHIKYTITFDPSKSLEYFDLQFNNSYTGNIRVTNIKLTVLTVN